MVTIILTDREAGLLQALVALERNRAELEHERRSLARDREQADRAEDIRRTIERARAEATS